MPFETINNFPEAENQQDKLKKEFQDDFNKNLEANNLEIAEEKLNQAHETGLIEEREYDHKQADVFRAFRENKNWDGVSRIIKATKDYYSQHGRIQNFEQVSGKKYKGERILSPEESNFSQEEKEKLGINSTKSFREALSMGELGQAEKWLNEVRQKRDQFPQYDDRWIDHREDELFKIYIKKEDLDSANRIIENMQNTEHAKKYNSRQGRIDHLSGLIDKTNPEKI